MISAVHAYTDQNLKFLANSTTLRNSWRIPLQSDVVARGEFRYEVTRVSARLALDDVIGQCTNAGDGDVDDVARPECKIAVRNNPGPG